MKTSITTLVQLAWASGGALTFDASSFTYQEREWAAMEVARLVKKAKG